MHIHLQCMECNHRLEFRQRSGFHLIFNHIIQFSFRLRQEGTWPFYQIGSRKTECMPSSHTCLDYVLSCSILLGLSGRPVCSFLALYPDADVHGSSLMAQEDGDGHWHVSIDLSGSIAITKDHNQVAKLSSPLCTIATLSCQDWRFSNINSFTCTKLARPWI